MPELMSPSITSFNGSYRWLSNFWPAPVTYEGLVYPSVEHAYQAPKTLDPTQREAIQRLARPGDAKRMGRQVTLRPDWREEKRLSLMFALLRQKFQKGTLLHDKLLATKSTDLIEGNYWHDNFWGVCNCSKCSTERKHNWLGFLLMLIRAGNTNLILVSMDRLGYPTRSTGPR